MLLLDTNVVSEAMRRTPDPAVMAWLGEQPPERTHLSAITIAEIHYGVNLIGASDRRRDILGRFNRFVAAGFDGRVFDFDRAAAERYGEIAAERRNAGRPITVPDAQIAATAWTNGLRLATRNIRDFDGLGLELVDPWDLPIR